MSPRAKPVPGERGRPQEVFSDAGILLHWVMRGIDLDCCRCWGGSSRNTAIVGVLLSEEYRQDIGTSLQPCIATNYFPDLIIHS